MQLLEISKDGYPSASLSREEFGIHSCNLFKVLILPRRGQAYEMNEVSELAFVCSIIG